MCGRFVQYNFFAVLAAEFGLKGEAPLMRPSWNIAPTQMVPTVVQDDERRLVMCRWGLIPHWSKDPAVGSRMINARAETLSEKPSFRVPFRKHRCLVVADGFFEWRKDPSGRKTPVYVHMRDGAPMGFAGLFSDWTPPDGGASVRTCAIVTTEANDLLRPVHDRMPVVLRREDRDAWLEPGLEDTRSLTRLLAPPDPALFEMWEVSTRVNSPGNDGPENIRRVGEEFRA